MELGKSRVQRCLREVKIEESQVAEKREEVLEVDGYMNKI